MSTSASKPTFIKFLVIFFPMALIFMAGGSLILFEQRRADGQDETPLSQPVTTKGLLSHYKKLEEFMTPRGLGTEKEVENLMRTTAFIEGSLSYMNTGINVESEKVHTESGRIWKSYRFHVKGRSSDDPQTFLFNYQSVSNEELASIIALAEAFPNMNLARDVTVEFSPITPYKGEHELVKGYLEEARRRGEGNVLCHAGIDWNFLAETLQDQLKIMQIK